MVVDVVKRGREGTLCVLGCLYHNKSLYKQIIIQILYNLQYYEIFIFVFFFIYNLYTDGFTGIYSSMLSHQCWSADSQRVLIASAQRSRKVQLIDKDTLTITILFTQQGKSDQFLKSDF